MDIFRKKAPAPNNGKPAAMQGKPVRVIAITGGKGGVGKTNTSVNLAIAFAKMGKKTLLLDADLGLANVDVLLGINAAANLSHVLSGRRSLQDIIVQGPQGLQVVPAASGIARMSELSPGEHAGLIHAFSDLSLPLDVMIVDTAAGIAGSVVSFVKASQEILVVVCDEPTSITDAYGLIKVLSRDHSLHRFHIICNMVRDKAHGEALFRKISAVAHQFLDANLNYLGAVPFDESLRAAVQHQNAVIELYPRSKSALAFEKIAEQINQWPLPDRASGSLQFFFETLIGFNGTDLQGSEVKGTVEG